MKYRNLIPISAFIKRNARGQALVEFILLLVVISGISFAFVGFMNSNLTRYWEYSVNLIVDDRPGTKTVTFD